VSAYPQCSRWQRGTLWMIAVFKEDVLRARETDQQPSILVVRPLASRHGTFQSPRLLSPPTRVCSPSGGPPGLDLNLPAGPTFVSSSPCEMAHTAPRGYVKLSCTRVGSTMAPGCRRARRSFSANLSFWVRGESASRNLNPLVGRLSRTL
jgi:hypothetical protein